MRKEVERKQQQLKTNVLSRSYRLLVINMRIYTKTPRLIKTWVQSPERGGTLLFDLNRYVPLGGMWFLGSWVLNRVHNFNDYLSSLTGCLFGQEAFKRVWMLAMSIRGINTSPGLCFKTRVGAQPLIRKSFFILMQIKLIFTRKVVHLASFGKWGFLELGSGLFHDVSMKRVEN